MPAAINRLTVMIFVCMECRLIRILPPLPLRSRLTGISRKKLCTPITGRAKASVLLFLKSLHKHRHIDSPLDAPGDKVAVSAAHRIVPVGKWNPALCLPYIGGHRRGQRLKHLLVSRHGSAPEYPVTLRIAAPAVQRSPILPAFFDIPRQVAGYNIPGEQRITEKAVPDEIVF